MSPVSPSMTTSKFQPCVEAYADRRWLVSLNNGLGEGATYVWVSASGVVEHAGEVRRDGLLEARDGGRLVAGNREQIREPASGEVDRDLRVHAERRADGGHEGTRRGEDGNERVVRALVWAVVAAAHATVARCVEDGDTLRTERAVGVAQFTASGL